MTVPAGSQSATFPITTFAVPFEIDSYVDAYSGSSLTRQYIFVKPGGEVAGMAAGAREWDSAEMRALLLPLLPAR